MGVFDFSTGSARARTGDGVGRADLYQSELDAQRAQYARQQQLASGRIGQAVSTAMGTTGNAAMGGRLAAQEAGRVQGDLANAEAAAAASLRAQQAQREQQAQTAGDERARQMIGGLLGGAGQVLGMAVPAFGALNGAAGGLIGGATGAPPAPGGAVGMIGSALGGPQTAPLGAPPAPQTIGGGVIGGAGPIGPRMTPQFSAPSGEVETFEERMRRLSLGGGFLGSPSTLGPTR